MRSFEWYERRMGIDQIRLSRSAHSTKVGPFVSRLSLPEYRTAVRGSTTVEVGQGESIRVRVVSRHQREDVHGQG
jgi:hypothetical protein